MPQLGGSGGNVVNNTNGFSTQPGGLLWRWNGVDVSQFDSVLRYSTGTPSGWVPGAATTSVGSISPQPGGTRLVLPSSGNGTSGVHVGIYPITDPLPPSYEVKISGDFSSVDTGNAGYGWFGWGNLDNTSTPYGYVYCPKGGRCGRLDGSTTMVSGTSSTINGSFSAQHTYRIEGRNDDTDSPRGQWLYRCVFGTSDLTFIHRNAFNASDGTWSFPSLPTWGGSGGAMDRGGLVIFSTGGGGGAPTVYINSVTIVSI